MIFIHISRVRRTRAQMLVALAIGIAILLATLSLVPPSFGEDKPSEYQVEAAYLLNFARYVKWPNDHAAALNICIFGQDPFGPTLDRITAGETYNGNPVTVRRITNVANIPACRIVFLQSADRAVLSSLAAASRRDSVLTVSTMPGFLDHGGMIQFVIQNDRVRFNVNLESSRAAGLSFSSELLRVAQNVRGR